MLTVKIKNIIFRSPIMVASGTFGYGDEVKDLVDISKIGCIITKSVTLNPREGNNPPRIAETSSGCNCTFVSRWRNRSALSQC